MTHAWCSDPSRDAAVRAAEDGRDGALPTLAEAIEAVTKRRPADARGEEMSQQGMRTERVTLEITHDLDTRLSDWIVEVIDESLGLMESVRVVSDEEPRGWLTEQEKAAIRWAMSEGFDEEVLRNLLARSTPPEQPRGWLTERDRKTLIDAAVFLSGKGERGMSEAIEWILARSTPPEVVLPRSFNVEGPGALSWHEMRQVVIAALAAAGVNVKEVP